MAPRIEFGSQLSWFRHATDSKGEFINVEGPKDKREANVRIIVK